MCGLAPGFDTGNVHSFSVLPVVVLMSSNFAAGLPLESIVASPSSCNVPSASLIGMEYVQATLPPRTTNMVWLVLR